jgi:hypothetical protein
MVWATASPAKLRQRVNAKSIPANTTAGNDAVADHTALVGDGAK